MNEVQENFSVVSEMRNPIVVRLMGHVTDNDIGELRKLLSENSNLDIIGVRDSKDYTLLHKATLNNHVLSTQVLIEFAEKQANISCRSQDEVSQRLRDWINTPN
jgi:ankyrin repeat protein